MKWFWGNISYIAALFVGTWLVAYKMPKRKHFWIRLVGAVILITAIKLLLDRLFVFGKPLREVVTINVLISFVLYLLTCGGVMLCFKCDVLAALFCGTAGYCMQHISQRTDKILASAFSVSNLHPIVSALILIAITALVYAGIYFTLIKPRDCSCIIVDNKIQLIVTVLVILCTIFLNTFASWLTRDKALKIYLMLFSVFVGLLGLMLEFNMLSLKNIERENSIINRLMEEGRTSYEFEKSMIELVNVKCHDLKYQLNNLESNKSEEELKELKEIIKSYDSIFKTGNNALNVVLFKKTKICREKDIEFTCLADGQKLSFMSESDIYTLFGNILDNAIMAVDKVAEKDKRIISILISQTGSFVHIRAMNYYEGVLKYVNGLPQTDKNDNAYHGFGMRSIKMITEKYGGDMRIRDEEQIFLLDLMFLA